MEDTKRLKEARELLVRAHKILTMGSVRRLTDQTTIREDIAKWVESNSQQRD